ncbi:MFS transporter [Devosia sp.]|uniref:MFS transporter n=1 Tax=Devosia sp. TaxID=1871048 RepID=UPI003A935103
MRIAPQQRVYAIFFLFALALGAMLSRLPDLQDQLGVGESGLGLTLIGMAIGSLLSLTFSSPLIQRVGARITAMVTVFGTASMFALVAWLPSGTTVFFALFVAGLLGGALEINANMEADKLEAQLGRRIMNRAHGMWSAGFFIAALLGAVMRQFTVSIQWHTLGTLLVVLVVGGIAFAGMHTAPKRPGGHEGETPRIALPTIGLLPLCFIGIAAFLTEGAGVDWSAIYMRDVFSVEPFIGGLGLTLFSFFMAVVRLFADPFVERFGPRRVATVLLVISIIGMLAVSFAPVPLVALIGFSLLGAGCSAVYPLAVSAAAQRTDRPSAVNVAAISQMTFVIFFLAPPLLGFVAEHLGIRNSYLVCLPLLVLALFAVPALGGRTTARPTANVMVEPPHA